MTRVPATAQLQHSPHFYSHPGFVQQHCRRHCSGARPVAVKAVADVAPGTADDDQQYNPYYTKFWTLSDTIKASIREWKDLSADGVELPPATPWSNFVCALLWVKYTLVPEPIRYVWYCIWTAACRFWYPFHKKLVIEGAKLDVFLSAKANPGKHVTVDRALALKRFHWRTNAAQDVWYRLQLLVGVLTASFRRQQPAAAAT